MNIFFPNWKNYFFGVGANRLDLTGLTDVMANDPYTVCLLGKRSGLRSSFLVETRSSRENNVEPTSYWRQVPAGWLVCVEHWQEQRKDGENRRYGCVRSSLIRVQRMCTEVNFSFTYQTVPGDCDNTWLAILSDLPIRSVKKIRYNL